MRGRGFLSKFFGSADLVRAMLRFLRNLLLVLMFSGLTAGAVVLWLSPDPRYTFQSWLALGRFSSWDELILEQSTRHEVDPLLVKAVVWRESAFDPEKTGGKGERGLMQIGEAAAADWARVNKIETFLPTDLFDARTNIEVGTWYLRRALDKWKDREDPIPFALAEYNAGGTRVDRWVTETKAPEHADAQDLIGAIDFPTTRRYVEDIVARHRFYRKRGGM